LWDTGNMNPGTSKTTTFNTAGTFGFHCTYHAAMGMTGTITVH
jgi:plastocyanin